MLRGSTKKTKPVEVNEAAIDAMFSSYADEDDSDSMSMDGIVKLCEELEIDPSTDVRVLVLMWKLGATSKPGTMSRKEFLEGEYRTIGVEQASKKKFNQE